MLNAQSLRHCLAALILLGSSVFSTSLQAVPPAAPTNGRAEYTHFGYPKNDPVNNPTPTADWRSWYVTWQDNANDEEGYFVTVRYGTVGPFYPVATLNPDTTNASFSVEGVSAGFPVQIRIEAWKRNGGAVESSSFTIATSVPAQTGPEFSPPSPLTGSGAAATAAFSAGAVSSITVTSPGSGYTVPPSVVISGGNGSGAVATATLTEGVVTAITVTSPGTGYTAAPTVSITPKLHPRMVDKDPSPSVTNLEDGLVLLEWKDNSSTEQNFLIRAREFKAGVTDNDWVNLPLLPFNHTSAIIPTQFLSNAQPLFIPGKTYDFQVRASRNNNTELTNSAACEPIAMPPLKAPSDLNASTVDETQVRLTWTDNSTRETGYEVEFRTISAGSNPPFELAGTVGENTNTVTVPVSQNSTAEFRVRAVFAYTPTGTTTVTKVYSDYNTGSAQASTLTFAAPSELTAIPSPGADSTILLTWKDNSLVESGFDILARPVGSSSSFKFARAVQPGVTSVSVDSIAGTVGTNDLDPNNKGRPIATNFVKLTPGTEYEFVVQAVGDSESVVSVSSNAATATPRVGFTMSRLYHPAQVGQAFSYQLTTSSSVGLTSWSASGLPPGLSFESSSGLITGTPTQGGIFLCPLSASFSNGVTASTTLTLRVLGVPGTPTAASLIPNITVGLNTPAYINLADKFSDPDAETAVRMVTSRGNIDLLLFPSLAPAAVANFLSYVNAGDYNNVVFHRSISNFVIQAGSYRAVAAPRFFSSVSGRSSPLNEPGISNLRGTIASAKIGARTSIFNNGTNNIARDDDYGYIGLPNSATTDFFLNLANNADNLDNQNGGFTAFGRMTTASLSVIDQIAALPQGYYLNPTANTGSSYNAALDKRIFLDGSPINFGSAPTDDAPASGFPMNAATAPADMDINKTVRILSASVIPTLSYSTDEVSADKAAVVVENGQLKITGLSAGSRTVNVTARDLDGNTVSRSFTITVTPGHLPPAITKQPASLIVDAGKTATFSVTATGTGLGYQWRRGGANITGKTDPTLTLTNAQAGEAGVYDVLVSNATGTLTSVPVTLGIRAPADITSTLPNELLIEAGQPLDLAVTVTGTPDPTFTWRRGSTVIKGQTTKRLLINATTLTDAGIYKGTAANGKTDVTNACNVLIVDKARRTVVAAPGKSVKLTAPVAGPFLSYRWRKGGVNIPLDEPGFSGMTSATLSIKAASFGTDSGDYTCVVIPPGTLPPTVSGIVHLAVSNAPQLSPMTGDDAPPAGIVGNVYVFDLPYPRDGNGDFFDSNTPASFVINKLPPGLTYNAATGRIFGIPTKTGSFTFTAQAKNATGAGSIVSGTIAISSMLAATTGSYVALVNPSPAINGDHGGRLQLTITDNAAFSASLQLGKDTYPLKGSLILGSNSGNAIYLTTLSFKSKAGKMLTLSFNIFAGTGTVVGEVSDGTVFANLSGYRQFWEAIRLPNSFSGRFNLALSLRSTDVSKPEIPQGDGYMTLSSARNGIGTLAGRLPDGTTITGSSIVSNGQGEVILFQMLYGNAGSLISRVRITIPRDGNSDTDKLIFNSYNGEARLIKNPPVPTKDLLYKTGIPATLMDVRGWAYQEPDSTLTSVVMNLTNVADNAWLDFSEGGLASAAQNPDTKLTLDSINKATFPTPNPTLTTLKVDPTTGAYSGTFTLVDAGKKRPATFMGLIIPGIAEIPALPAVLNSSGLTVLAEQAAVSPTGTYGAGYFLLDQLPTPPSTKVTERRSGKARLSAKPLTFTDQPQSVTVEPDADPSFTFTVAANSGLNASNATLSYQWRKNGVKLTDGTGISGVTTTTLSLTDVDQSDEGSYDCLVTQTVSITPAGETEPTPLTVNIMATQLATLTVNDPVSDVIVIQTPAAALQPEGAQITFSVENQGTGPFEYQWQKDSVNIPSATDATYVIPSMTVADVGAYRVIVKRTVNSTTVTSAAKSLSHAFPVTTVTASKSVNSALVGAGSNLKFTATANGSEPRTYQWFKNNIPITAAQSATFTIGSTSLTDNGAYKVQVTNSVTDTPVNSNEVQVEVTQGITNIVITKSYTEVAALPNTPVTFSVANQGTGPFEYQWRKNGVNIEGETSTSLNLVTGAEANTTNPDIYDVLITSALLPQGVASSGVELLISIPVTSVTASRNPAASSLITGTNGITFTAVANGSDVSYQWRKDGTDIQGATSATYVINAATPARSGNYSVRVSNFATPAGVTSAIVPLNVMDPVQSATIILNDPASTTVSGGASLNFSAAAAGGASFTYQWRKNGENISGATDAVLQTTADIGVGDYLYDVVIFNPVTPAGVTSDPITITVQ